MFEDFVPMRDATFAARLRAAGAIIFAKNNTPEFSMNRRSLNLVTRECLTPWDPELEYAMSIPPRVRYRPVNDLDDVFARYDLLACPVIVRPAFVAGEPGVTRWKYTEYTMIVNAAGYTAASVPAGFVEGLPVGLQLIAPPDREPLVLRAARALERARPWARHRPPIS